MSSRAARPHDRIRRPGGFLLDTAGSTRSSLDVPRHVRHEEEPSFPSSSSSAMVQLILNEVGRQKEAQRSSSGSHKLQRAPPSPVRRRRESGRAISPSRGSFLISGRRSPSTPGAPVRPTFQTIEQGIEGKRRSSGKQRWESAREALQKLQSEYEFSEATLQRTLKAKQSFELAAAFRDLLELEGKSVGPDAMRYNPLEVIRNRKVRARKKEQVDVAPWEDSAAVEEWVRNITSSVTSPSGLKNAGCLPDAPQCSGRRLLKRPKLEWDVAPEEMFADYYWMSKYQEKGGVEDESRQRRRRVLSIDSKENDRRSTDSTRPNNSTDLPRKRLKGAAPLDYQPSHRRPSNAMDYDSTATSSDDDASDAEALYTYPTDSDYVSEDGKGSKRQRGSRTLGRIIKGPRGRKKEKLLQQQVAEQRRKQEAEDVDWSETDETTAGPLGANQLDYRKSVDLEDGYESSAPGSLAKLLKRETGKALPFGGSKSSLDPYAATGGLGTTGDRADFVVPSIAISLSPPRVRSREDIEEREEKTIISPKKLLDKGKDALAINKDSKDSAPDASIRTKKSADSNREGGRDKSHKALGRVKTRVDKLRTEFTRVEDYIGWKTRESPSAAASPTASSFTGSDDDADPVRRDGAASASELDDDFSSTRARASLEVPPAQPRLPKHRSHISTSQVPAVTTHFKHRHRNQHHSRDVDSSREPSPIRDVQTPLHRGEPAPVYVHRETTHAHASLLAAGILTHALLSRPPPSSINHTTHTLQTLHTNQSRFATITAPHFSASLTTITATITSSLIPQLRDIADECDVLERMLTSEFTAAIGGIREDLRRIRRRARWRVRGLARVGFALVEKVVIAVLWAVWGFYMCVLLVMVPVLWVVRSGGRGVRWLLWF